MGDLPVGGTACSICAAVSATAKRRAWRSAIGRPNCSRSCRWTIESSRPARARPTARAAVCTRAVSSHCCAAANPAPRRLALLVTGGRLVDDVDPGDADAVEDQAPGEEPVVADLVDRGAGEAGRGGAALLLLRQVHQARRPGLPRSGVALADEHLDEVGGPGVAAPALVAGDHPLVAVEDRAGGHPGEVGAGVGLGQGDGADPLAPGAAAQQLRAPGGVGHRRPQALRAGQDAGAAHPGAGQLLGDRAVLEDAEAHPAVLRGHGDPEPWVPRPWSAPWRRDRRRVDLTRTSQNSHSTVTLSAWPSPTDST